MKATDGLDLKAGQAHNIVQEKSLNGMHVHIGQYLLLPSYFDWLKEIDPDGNLVLETQPCSWTNKEQFKRLYISFSYVQKFWRKGGCLPLYAVDGTFTMSGKFKHTILFAVSYDANNKLVMLAYAICDKENEDNWLWFLRKLINNFPGSKCILGDFVKGLQSHSIAELLANNNIKFSRCVRHMCLNCKTAHAVPQGKNRTFEEICFNLAKALTRERYESCLSELHEKIGEDHRDWWSSKYNQFASYHFIENGVKRYGKVTSNAAEQLNSVHTDNRTLPILLLLESINIWSVKMFFERKVSARNVTEPLTNFAFENHTKMLELASRRSVSWVEWNGTVVSGVVTNPANILSSVRVSLETNNHVINCPCKYVEDTGMLCVHAAALLRHVQTLDVNSIHWYESRFSNTSYADAYDVELPSTGLDRALKVSDLLPPEHKATAGRPRRQRIPSGPSNKTICLACGQTGHYQKTCPRPSTKV